jgi:hypothetical protein
MRSPAALPALNDLFLPYIQRVFRRLSGCQLGLAPAFQLKLVRAPSRRNGAEQLIFHEGAHRLGNHRRRHKPSFRERVCRIEKREPPLSARKPGRPRGRHGRPEPLVYRNPTGMQLRKSGNGLGMAREKYRIGAPCGWEIERHR